MANFHIRHLVWLTIAAGLVFAAMRAIGVPASAAIAAMFALGTPLVAFLVACIPDHWEYARRIRVGVGISLVVLFFNTAFATAFGGWQGAVTTVIGLTFLWGMQWALLAIVYAAWKSGMQAAAEAERSIGYRVSTEPVASVSSPPTDSPTPASPLAEPTPTRASAEPTPTPPTAGDTELECRS